MLLALVHSEAKATYRRRVSQKSFYPGVYKAAFALHKASLLKWLSLLKTSFNKA